MLSTVNHAWGIAVATTVVIAANVSVVIVSITQNNTNLHAENALLENIQATFLAMAALGYLFLRPRSPGERNVYLGVALLSFSFVLRELDLDRMNVPLLARTLGSGPGRVVLLSGLWILLSAHAWRSISAKVQFLRQFLGSQLFLVLLAAFCLLLLGAMMDKNIFSMTQARLAEELLETNAYLLLVLPLLFKSVRAIGSHVTAAWAQEQSV